jgi:hypothetical protein
MSKRNALNKAKLEKLNEINHIDKRCKRKKVRENEDELKKLMSRRNVLRTQLKTSK